MNPKRPRRGTVMEEIRLENYRCFHDKQTARLARLTLLVGENSTGKTSLMAMIRVLLDAAYGLEIDFKKEPYDLGSFDEIAHYRGARGGRRADRFEAGFSAASSRKIGSSSGSDSYRFEVAFGERGATPVPVKRRLALGDTWVDDQFEAGRLHALQVGTSRGTWKRELPAEYKARRGLDFDEYFMLPPFFALRDLILGDEEEEESPFIPLSNSPAIIQEDMDLIRKLVFLPKIRQIPQPFASAPVRSRPRRTYDPSRPVLDPEGYHIPMYIANMHFQDKKAWDLLKTQLEDFGKFSGLFDEISIRPLGKRESEPFQVQVRKFGGKLKGPPRNLADVGYGVSQVLPVITELLRPGGPTMFLLQQPEVHLHPSAQAALGSLFCQLAGSKQCQLVVETHSDHLIDRVRMDVRDGAGALKPDDVSILFFERDGLNVCIHSLRLDSEGNILNVPNSYRRFFMEETQRSLRI